MDINFVKEQFEIAKRASHLSETIVVDVKTFEWMISEIERLKADFLDMEEHKDQEADSKFEYINRWYKTLEENKHLKERNSRYAEKIVKLKDQIKCLKIELKFTNSK